MDVRLKMNQQQALIKLAQVRLAINYVIRNRMEKKADFTAPEFMEPHFSPISSPTLDSSPISEIGGPTINPIISSSDTKQLDLVPKHIRHKYGDMLLPDEGVYRPGQPYRPTGWQGELDVNNLNYQSAMLRDLIGPLWNKGLDWWDYQRKLPGYKWNDHRLNYASNYANASGRYNDKDFDEALDTYEQLNPRPQEPTPIPKKLYMTTPYITRDSNGRRNWQYSTPEYTTGHDQ